MFWKIMPMVALFVLVAVVPNALAIPWFYSPRPPVPTIPGTAIVEHSYSVPTGHLCMTGDEFHTLSDDVFGTHTGQGVFNEYIVTITGDGGFDYFRLSIDLLGYHAGDKMIISLKDHGQSTVSSYFHLDTPVYKIQSGTYTIQVGYLKVASIPAAYRINMG